MSLATEGRAMHIEIALGAAQHGRRRAGLTDQMTKSATGRGPTNSPMPIRSGKTNC